MHRLISDNNIVRTANGDPVHGGTTATVSVLVRDIDPETHNSVLITANVGDSTGLLVSPGDPVAFTTVDHGPESESEYARVQDMNLQKSLLFVYDKTNVFRKYECPAIFKPNGVKDEKFVTNPWGNGLHPTNVRYEPAVYAVTPRTVSKDSTCIAMTRALGDFYAHPFGLTSVPDIQVQQLSAEKDYVVIVGSDGIWDCWKYEDYSNYTLLGLYNKNQSILEFGEEALNESIRRAYTNFGPKHYDDAALVMFRLQASESKNNAASNTSSNTVENASSQPTNSQQVPATEVDGDVVMSPTKSATEL
jgi:serine/threonine protein phosphatase PrpC